MSLMPIQGYSPNRQDYIDDPDTFNFRVPTLRPTRPPRPLMSSMDRDIFGRPSVDNRGKFMRQVGETPRLGGYSDRRAKLGNVTPVPRPEPIQFNEPFTQQPRQLGVSGDNNSAEASRRGQLGQQPQFGQVQQQPQFNQQGMQQMMQFMQQMMQMFSMMSGQGGQGGFGGGYMNQGPYGGGFGQGGYQQFQQPQQRPMPRYPRMQNNYSQSPFGRY